MRYYEMLFIVHPNYEQDRMDAVLDAVHKEITGKGAKILKTDNWGKRKLAYLINKQRYGSYVLMYFEADPSMIQGLYEWMEIQSPILHQMVIRLDEKPEISEVSENPDSSHPSSRPSHGSKFAPKAEPAKEEAPKAAPVEASQEVVAEAPVEDVVEETVTEVVAEEVVAEAPVEDVVEETVTEVVAEEVVAEEAKVEAPAEETAEVKGE